MELRALSVLHGPGRCPCSVGGGAHWVGEPSLPIATEGTREGSRRWRGGCRLEASGGRISRMVNPYSTSKRQTLSPALQHLHLVTASRALAATVNVLTISAAALALCRKAVMTA
jgi:hypothetical protein